MKQATERHIALENENEALRKRNVVLDKRLRDTEKKYDDVQKIQTQNKHDSGRSSYNYQFQPSLG